VKHNVVLTDIAAITSMGPDFESLWNGLCENRSSIKKVTRFSTENCISPYAALIDDLVSVKEQSMIYTLSDKLLKQMQKIPKDSLLFTATTKSGIDSLEKMSPEKTVEGNNFLLSALPQYISGKLSLSDPGINISSACASSTIALAKAAFMISAGLADSILICSMDVISRFVFSGFSALGAMSDSPAKPFDLERNGLTLGEAACGLLLMSEERALKEKRKTLAHVKGWGIANDATHLTAPARDGCGLKQAAGMALLSAGIQAGDVAAVNAHGTGTVYNDLMEIVVFRSLFQDREIPVNSVKGAIGHTLGAAGGLEVALGAKMLSEGLVPGTCGFLNPEKGAEKIISNKNKTFTGEYLLTTNSGFGGTNAAIILKKGELS